MPNKNMDRTMINIENTFKNMDDALDKIESTITDRNKDQKYFYIGLTCIIILFTIFISIIIKTILAII